MTSFESSCVTFAKPMFDYNVTIMYSLYKSVTASYTLSCSRLDEYFAQKL